MEALLEESLIVRLTDHLADDRIRTRFRETVAELIGLPEREPDLASFLASFGDLVAELFAANSVAIWFRTASGDAIQRRVEVSWQRLALEGPIASAHESLVQFASQQDRPLAVAPFAAPHSRAGVSNPTDSFLLFAPARFDNENVATLEIALGPKPLRRPHLELTQSYVDWLTWLASVLERGMRQSFGIAAGDLQLAMSLLQRTSSEAEVVQDQIRILLQESLRGLAGKNFGSLASNQAVVKRVHELLDSKGLRVKCPECGVAAILRCQNAGNSKTGAFVFDHYLDSGRTFHGGPSSFPAVELISKPPRRRSK